MNVAPSGSFSTVDGSPNSAGLVNALDQIASLPAVQRLKALSCDLLAPRAGQTIVDVGCGSGDDVRALAPLVGPTGRIIGIDASDVMLAEARRRTEGRDLPVEFRRGDATQLDLDDRAADGCRSERVFQHLDEPARATAELVRITRPGGRIVVIDTDWGMHAVQGACPELTRRVLAGWCDEMPNGLSGRRLRGLFVDAGIADPLVLADTFTLADGEKPRCAPFPFMAAAAERAGAITAEEGVAWLEQLAAAGREGHFFWAVTMFAVAGRRP